MHKYENTNLSTQFQFLTNPVLFDVSFQNVEHCCEKRFMYAKILDVLYNYSRCTYKRTNDNVCTSILFVNFLLYLYRAFQLLGSRDITSFVYIRLSLFYFFRFIVICDTITKLFTYLHTYISISPIWFDRCRIYFPFIIDAPNIIEFF